MRVDVLRLNNRAPAFYPLLGPLLADRQVVDELGTVPWDDRERHWWVAFAYGHLHDVAGFAAAAAPRRDGVIRFGAAWVRPDMRRRGVHRQLLAARLDAYDSPDFVAIEADCTPASLPNFLAAGFEVVEHGGNSDSTWVRLTTGERERCVCGHRETRHALGGVICLADDPACSCIEYRPAATERGE